MKTMINTLGKRVILFYLFLVSLSGYSQATLSVTLANGSSTSNTFEFDLMLVVAAPTAGVVINAVTAGVEYNTGILNGGLPCTTAGCGSVTLIPGTAAPELAAGGLTPYTLTNRASPLGHLRLVQAPNPASTASVLPGTYRVGRFKFTNTVAWTTNSNANLWLKPTNSNPTGSTNTLVSAEPAGQGTQISYSTTVGTPPLTLGFTSVSTFSIPLNVAPTCPTAATASSLVAESPCAGAANGSALITLTGAPSATSAVTYTVDGGATQNATLSAGAFSVSNLSAGSHIVEVTYPSCPAVSTSSFTIDAGAPLTTTGSVTTSICAGDSYVWPANGVTYTSAQSGLTFVSGCNTATLNLTITPVTTTGSVTTSICAGSSYTWPANGVTYTSAQSGVTVITGCNTATLNLTITPVTTTGSVTTSICAGASYTWPANGVTYTSAQSGLTVITGCNTATLNLTITPATTTSESQTVCGTSYTWPTSGVSYTASGSYTHVVGCNTATLTLTLTPSSTNTTTITASGSYTWANNGQTYSASGTYTGSVVNCVIQVLDLTITPVQSGVLSLKVYLEGYYLSGGQMRSALANSGIGTNNAISDTIKVQLRSQSSPNASVLSANVLLSTNGTASISIPPSLIGGNYYIAVYHRNSLETWSSIPIAITAITDFDFTTSSSQAYGAASMKQVEAGVWALYSGDHNQDGAITPSDLGSVATEASLFSFGYIKTDLTGDGAIDGFDLGLADNNSNPSLVSSHP
jgi:hypothetical protein